VETLTLFLIIALLFILVSTLFLLFRNNEGVQIKQNVPKNAANLEGMPDDLDAAMEWLESLAQREGNKEIPNDSHDLPEWLADLPRENKDPR
jgi:hypothetical protein